MKTQIKKISSILALVLLAMIISAGLVFGIYAATTETYGDMNDDGAFDSADLIYMLRTLANWTGYSMTDSQETLADLDLNGYFEVADVVIASRHLANWQGYANIPVEAAGKLPFSKGINVNGLESFSTDSYDRLEDDPDFLNSVISEDTYKGIKEKGFDYVRLCVNLWRAYLDDADKYTTEQFMGFVDTAINHAINNGLYVMLSFHGWFNIGDEANDYEECLYIWEQVAERYKDYDKKLSFELLNEPWYENSRPRPYLSDAKLNELQTDLISIIRSKGSKNATRLIVCCTADGNKAWKLSALSLPEDVNLAVAIHEYEPYNFTHQNFSWAGLSGQTTTLDAQGGFTAKTSYDFGEITKFMDRTGIPVILNEFGMNLAKTSAEDIQTYTRGIVSFCEENDIPWAYWQYYDTGYSSEGSMSIYRKKNSYFWTQHTWDQTLLDAMFGE